MKDKLQLNRTNIIMLSIVLIHSLISLWTDKLIFSYNPISFRYSFFKIIFLICVFAFWKLIFYVISSIKNNVIIQRQVIYFLIYAGIMLILMILIWPGVWRNDEFYILNAAKELRFLGWYHAISSMTYIMSLMFMPFAAGIVIVQLLLISGICSYIISKFEESFLSRIKVRKRSLLLVLLFIPFLLLPVIDHNFYPMRHVLNGYFELLLIFEFLLICLKKQKITTNHLCFLYILSVVVCSWRSEQIYYVIMIPVILFTLGKNILTIQKKLIFTMLLFMAVVAINRFNSSISDSTRYKVIATVMPVTELVKAANPVEDKELLDMLGKVVYLDIIYDNPQLYGEVLFWFYGLDKQGEYKDEDYKDYQTAFVKLALKYPGVLIKERINNFAQTAALVPDIKVNIFRTYMLFDDFTNDDIPEFFTLHDAGLEKNRYPYFVRSN